jgi:hypothetical protein
VYANDKLRAVVPEYTSATPYAEGVRRTVAVMDQRGMIKPAESDNYEDKVIEMWQDFAGRARDKLQRAD